MHFHGDWGRDRTTDVVVTGCARVDGVQVTAFQVRHHQFVVLHVWKRSRTVFGIEQSWPSPPPYYWRRPTCNQRTTLIIAHYLSVGINNLLPIIILMLSRNLTILFSFCANCIEWDELVQWYSHNFIYAYNILEDRDVMNGMSVIRTAKAYL